MYDWQNTSVPNRTGINFPFPTKADRATKLFEASREDAKISSSWREAVHDRERRPASTPQLPLKTPQTPSNSDHKALNRGTLGGLGNSVGSYSKAYIEFTGNLQKGRPVRTVSMLRI